MADSSQSAAATEKDLGATLTQQCMTWRRQGALPHLLLPLVQPLELPVRQRRGRLGWGALATVLAMAGVLLVGLGLVGLWLVITDPVVARVVLLVGGVAQQMVGEALLSACSAHGVGLVLSMLQTPASGAAKVSMRRHGSSGWDQHRDGLQCAC